MGCTKCGTDLSSLHLIVKDIIRQLIDEGKLQEGLVDCTDKRLWRDSRVLTCDLLGDAVCQLITNGDICLVKPEALTVEKQANGSHKISLIMSDGTTLDTTARLTDGVLNSVTYDAKTKIATFTTTNGDSYEIKLDIPEPVEYTFTKKDDGVYSVAKNGKELLAINPGVLDVKIKGDKLHVTNAAGEVKQFDIPMPTVTPTELTDNNDGTGSVTYGDTTLSVMTRPTTATKAEDGVVTITNANGTTVEVPAIKVKAAKEADGKVVITNQDGSTVEIEKPAEFDLSQHVDNKTVRLKDGKLEVIKEKCAIVTNLNTLEASDGNLKQLGISCFTGAFNVADANTAIGAPVEFGKTNVKKSDAITTKEDITSGNQLDFTGWQVATDREVHQYIYSRVGDGVQSGWVRSNDSGMNADGTLKNPNDWGKWVYELNLPEQPVAPAGLDCAAIDALPERQWKKGTALLAKQDGECVRLVAFDSIFQEIGVGITADKTNAFVNEEYKVVVTVSNTGEGKNELTNLNIVGPANTADYEIKDVTFTKSEADEVEQVNNLTYNIRGLKKGGTVVVKYTVVPKVLGNYQFTAAVNPNSALDKDLGNNNATLILNARTKADPSYAPSVDCPLIIATELDSNTQLVQLHTERSGIKHVADTDVINYGNLFANRETLKGLKIRLENASTVVGYRNKFSNVRSYILSNGKVSPGYIPVGDAGLVYTSAVAADADGIKTGTDGYTFENGVLTITADVETFAISCRPQGSNCKWQNYMFSTGLAPTTKTITASAVTGGTTTLEDVYNKEVEDNNPNIARINVVPSDVTVSTTSVVRASVSRDERATRVQKLVFRVKAGTAASLNYTSTDNYAVIHSAGKTTITENSITVAADAKPTDSVNTKYIQVIVEE